MPYLQMDLDAMSQVPRVARAADLPESVVGWGLMTMWEWCWRQKRTTVSPVALAGFFGPSQLIREALEVFGFLEPAGGEYRVRGAERRLRVSERQSEAGKARARSSKRDDTGRLLAGDAASSQPAPVQPDASQNPALSSSIKHQTSSIQKEEEEAPPPPPSKFRRSMLPGPLQAPAEPPETWSAWDFWVWSQWAREQVGFVRETQPSDEKLDAFWRDVRARGCVVERLKLAFRAFAKDPKWEGATPPLPFSAFMAQWANYAPQEVKRGAA